MFFWMFMKKLSYNLLSDGVILYIQQVKINWGKNSSSVTIKWNANQNNNERLSQTSENDKHQTDWKQPLLAGLWWKSVGENVDWFSLNGKQNSNSSIK